MTATGATSAMAATGATTAMAAMVATAETAVMAAMVATAETAVTAVTVEICGGTQKKYIMEPSQNYETLNRKNYD